MFSYIFLIVAAFLKGGLALSTNRNVRIFKRAPECKFNVHLSASKVQRAPFASHPKCVLTPATFFVYLLALGQSVVALSAPHLLTATDHGSFPDPQRPGESDPWCLYPCPHRHSTEAGGYHCELTLPWAIVAAARSVADSIRGGAAASDDSRAPWIPWASKHHLGGINTHSWDHSESWSGPASTLSIRGPEGEASPHQLHKKEDLVVNPEIGDQGFYFWLWHSLGQIT